MKYTDLFVEISPQVIDRCEEVVRPDIRFKDPFNDVTGVASFKKILHKTLEDVQNPKFEILDEAYSESAHYVKWRFSGRIKALGDWDVEGMSALKYDPNGLVYEHVDYWDASEQFYEKLPVLGWPISFLKKRLQVS